MTGQDIYGHHVRLYDASMPGETVRTLAVQVDGYKGTLGEIRDDRNGNYQAVITRTSFGYFVSEECAARRIVSARLGMDIREVGRRESAGGPLVDVCRWYEAHTAKKVRATAIVDMGPVGPVPMCDECQKAHGSAS